MRTAVAFTLVYIMAAVSASAATVQLSRSTYHDQHVTIEDRSDHYLVHFNLSAARDQAKLGTHYGSESLVVDITFRWTALDGIENTWHTTTTVYVRDDHELWSFYFRIPKLLAEGTDQVYAVKAQMTGGRNLALVCWKMDGGRIDLGSEDKPLSEELTVAHAVRRQTGDSFRIETAYRTVQVSNNYDDLPVVGFLNPDKRMPETIDAERSAKKL